MPPLLADFFGDSTDSSTQANDQNFILDNSKSLLHLSSKLLGNIIVSTLQNAINSTSYIKHHRSLKSSLPFLYNQTIRKIDSRGSALLDVEASLMVRKMRLHFCILTFINCSNSHYYHKTI